MTGFFEVISISAPHIYHSTLLLSPETSIVRKLYWPQANPLARVVQGVPTSWDPTIATTSFPDIINTVAWSPCSRFIAISRLLSDNIAILDAVTLEQIYTTCSASQPRGPINLVFSPDGHLLTGYYGASGSSSDFIASWDLQTGGLISNTGGVMDSKWTPLMTYSGCGTMVGLLAVKESTITTYNVLSGTRISSHSVKKADTLTIWTHDECLRFATVELTSITIWEVGFTSRQPPTKVDSLPAPDGFTLGRFPAFFPTLSRLAFTFEERIIVWDTQHRKILLDSTEVTHPKRTFFSPDGRFVTCGAEGPEVWLWKESPDGYLLHQKFIAGPGFTRQTFSPDGESIVTFGSSIVQLWRTTDPPTSSSGVSIQSFQDTSEDFILEFSPGEKLVAVARQGGSTITVLDLESGDVRVVIDTGMELHGMKITGSAVVAATHGKVVTWDLPVGDDTLNARMGTNDSARTNVFDCLSPPRAITGISISPDLNYIATQDNFCDLHIYNIHTGKLLAVAKSTGRVPGFTPDGRKVWCARGIGDKVDQWEITGDGTPDITELESLWSAEDPPEGFPWRSSHGYEVTGDGWILNSSKKRLLWLPHHWRSLGAYGRMWRGKFLALLHGELPEVVVLELEP